MNLDEMSRPVSDPFLPKSAMPAVVFPLTGEWCPVISPGDRIPSRGTDALGQRYSYNFVQADDLQKANRLGQQLRFWLGKKIDLSISRGIGSRVRAPIGGRVAAAKDGWGQKRHVGALDIWRGMHAGRRLRTAWEMRDLRPYFGNYIIIEGAEGSALLAHLAPNSIVIAQGEDVRAGQLVGQVGVSGTATIPNLHYQLMDRPDLWSARGVASCFARYEKIADGRWHEVRDGVPRCSDRMRGS